MSSQDPTQPNVIEQFYDAFQARDGDAMQDCYAENATFRDPVFELSGAERIGGMWKMLLERGPDLAVMARDIETDDLRGRAHWEARYTFSGREVHNVVEATFALRDGRIVGHVDDFPFWRWARQALGPMGVLLGWTPMVRNRVRARALGNLESYLKRA